MSDLIKELVRAGEELIKAEIAGGGKTSTRYKEAEAYYLVIVDKILEEKGE